MVDGGSVAFEMRNAMTLSGVLLVCFWSYMNIVFSKTKNNIHLEPGEHEEKPYHLSFEIIKALISLTSFLENNIHLIQKEHIVYSF